MDIESCSQQSSSHLILIISSKSRPSISMSRSAKPPTITVPQSGGRPSSIAELANKAQEDVWPETRGLRGLLRAADRHWQEGKEYLEKGDLDNAYISLARAAPLVLEKLPSHPDYKTMLSDTQRHNLALVSRRNLSIKCIC